MGYQGELLIEAIGVEHGFDNHLISNFRKNRPEVDL